MRKDKKYIPIECEIDDRDNKFMYVLYGKPSKRFIKSKIKLFFEQRKHNKDYFKPMYESLLYESPDLNTMIQYADFIRLIERVLFYNNDIKIKSEDKDMIYSDSSISDKNKNLILILKDNVIITFNMYPDESKLTIDVNYNFGKKSKMKFTVIDREVCSNGLHDDNLMITILERLQEAMAALFKEYYLKI